MNNRPPVSHYVDNSVLTSKLTIWSDKQRALREDGLPTEQVPEYIAECILKICINIVRKPNFVNYTFKDEMIGDAVENCIRYVSNFNGARFNNAFAYISQLAYTSAIRRIKKEKLLTTKHIRFIRSVVDVSQLTSVITDVSDKEREHYEGYLEDLKNMIDESSDVPVDTQKIKKNIVESSILMDIMMAEGEDLL